MKNPTYDFKGNKSHFIIYIFTLFTLLTSTISAFANTDEINFDIYSMLVVDGETIKHLTANYKQVRSEKFGIRVLGEEGTTKCPELNNMNIVDTDNIEYLKRIISINVKQNANSVPIKFTENKHGASNNSIKTIEPIKFTDKKVYSYISKNNIKIY